MVLDPFTLSIVLLVIIVMASIVFQKSNIPISLLLVITGMFISFIPGFPRVTIDSQIVLNIFLPLLLYHAAAFASWRDFKKNMRPILLLSIGHVLFITALIAVTIHWLIPELGWPLAFVLGAVISPPDDVAIISIAEKIHFPNKILTILTGESLFNDATALILFRFALAAVFTHEFSTVHAISAFFMVVIGETLYGIALGYCMGQMRLQVKDSSSQIIISIITPFLAFLIPEKFGGSGVISTVVTGIFIGSQYLEKFPPEVRISAGAIWKTLSTTIQNILFLLVGLELRFIAESISSIPTASILLYSLSIIFVVIVGRFFWVFPATYLPRWIFPSIRKKERAAPWQAAFIISWAGMRGGISLAAALAVPLLPATVDGANARDLLVFIVFCVIAATLLFQGLTLPWLLKVLGITKYGEQEIYQEHVAELAANLAIKKAVLRWLKEFAATVRDDAKLCAEVKLRIKEYKSHKEQLKDQIARHSDDSDHDHDTKNELQEAMFLSAQLIAIERATLSQLWMSNRISHAIKTKLISQLDYREKHLTG